MVIDNFKEYTKTLSEQRFPTFCQMLYDIRLIKYASLNQIQSISNEYKKLISKAKIKDYLDLKILEEHNGIFKVSDNVKDTLHKHGFNKLLLPEVLDGYGDINQQLNTNIFIQALKLPDYKALLYPSFEYLIPDALLVRQSGLKYKLEFLEIEAKKPNWQDHCETKRLNYLRLSNDKKVYDYWCKQCSESYLNINKPTIENFKFSVTFIGDIKFDWGQGFNFKNKLD